MSDRRVLTVFALLLASGACCVALWLRMWQTGTGGYQFLSWNLFLAWVPFLAAVLLVDAHRRRGGSLALLGLGGLWLLFLPNAPYIATDLVHVGRIPGAPIWFDAALVASFAGTGLALGLGSLLLVQGVVTARLGRLAGWALPLPALALCSFGIALGRFERLNSWDALVDPSRVLDTLTAHAAQPPLRGLAMLVVATLALGVAYLVLVSFAGLVSDEARRSIP